MDNLAEVRLWGQRVGALAYNPATQLATFEYTESWQDKGIEIAPIRMPLSSQKYQFGGLSFETYKGLPAVFADALPDDFGNAVINAWLARKGRDPSSFTPVERLLYMGSRGMGALEFAPALNRGDTSEHPLALDSLVTLAQQVLNERTEMS